MSISNAGKAPISSSPDHITDRSSEKTDSLICQEIQNGMAGHFDISGDTGPNLGKVPFKLALPEFKGGDSIDEFLSFMKELVNYYTLHG